MTRLCENYGDVVWYCRDYHIDIWNWYETKLLDHHKHTAQNIKHSKYQNCNNSSICFPNAQSHKSNLTYFNIRKNLLSRFIKAKHNTY